MNVVLIVSYDKILKTLKKKKKSIFHFYQRKNIETIPTIICLPVETIIGTTMVAMQKRCYHTTISSISLILITYPWWDSKKKLSIIKHFQDAFKNDI